MLEGKTLIMLFVVIIVVLFLVIKLSLAAIFFLPLEAIYGHSYFVLTKSLRNICAMNHLPF